MDSGQLSNLFAVTFICFDVLAYISVTSDDP